MGIIHGVILLRSCSDLGKRLRIENLPSSQSGAAHFARARATVQTGDTDS
jgi:hypothetical protein